MRVTLPELLALVLAAPALAQSSLYDAGPGGSPPVAPSPAEQGWTRVAVGSIGESELSPDPDWPLNAWQLNDPRAGSSIRYAQEWPWITTDYVFTMVVRPLAGTLYVEIDTGDTLGADSVWQIDLELVGTDLVLDNGGSGSPYVLVGAGDGAYHEIQLRGFIYTLDLYYDGVFLGALGDTGWGLLADGAGIRWGTLDDEPGRARFHRVELTTTNWGEVGSSYCGPAVPHSGGQSAVIVCESYLVPDPSTIVRLRATDLPANEFGYFLVADAAGFVQPPGSSGNLCLAGKIGRYAADLQDSGDAGTFWIPAEPWSLPTNPPSSVQPGETWHFQAWFRDGTTSNFTDGRSVRF